MGPLNLTDNALVKALVLGGKRREGTLKPEDKIFKEKTVDELTAEDEIVDSSGNAIVRKKKSFEEILLNIWDSGADKSAAPVDITPLMDEINKSNCNFKTEEKGWTSLMILCGLGVEGCNGCISAIQRVISIGGDPAVKDSDGWNTMHWAAFHNSVEVAKVLSSSNGSLWKEMDAEGKKPLEVALAENNIEVSKFLQDLEPSDRKISKPQCYFLPKQLPMVFCLPHPSPSTSYHCCYSTPWQPLHYYGMLPNALYSIHRCP